MDPPIAGIKENRPQSPRLYISIGRHEAKRKSPIMPNHIFISYAAQEQEKAVEICAYLENSRIRCWYVPRDILPGMEWGASIVNAIRSSAALLLVLSPASNQSVQVAREISVAIENGLPVVPVLIEAVTVSRELSSLIGDIQRIVVTKDQWPRGLDKVAHALASFVPQIEQSGAPARQQPSEPETKGYVFISYDRSSREFVTRLTEILKQRKYAYWDYSESERDYHNALYKELEEKIENAKAFMSIVTDTWRDSEWPAAEYIYAKEAKVPVFVIAAKKLARPYPIIINQQTRIDMATDFERGALVLEHELDKKGL